MQSSRRSEIEIDEPLKTIEIEEDIPIIKLFLKETKPANFRDDLHGNGRYKSLSFIDFGPKKKFDNCVDIGEQARNDLKQSM